MHQQIKHIMDQVKQVESHVQVDLLQEELHQEQTQELIQKHVQLIQDINLQAHVV